MIDYYNRKKIMWAFLTICDRPTLYLNNYKSNNGVTWMELITVNILIRDKSLKRTGRPTGMVVEFVKKWARWKSYQWR